MSVMNNLIVLWLLALWLLAELGRFLSAIAWGQHQTGLLSLSCWCWMSASVCWHWSWRSAWWWSTLWPPAVSWPVPLTWTAQYVYYQQSFQVGRQRIVAWTTGTDEKGKVYACPLILYKYSHDYVRYETYPKCALHECNKTGVKWLGHPGTLNSSMIINLIKNGLCKI